MKATDLKKATTVDEVITYLDGMVPLEYGTPAWNAFYMDTRQRFVSRMYREFEKKPVGHKALFGGHAGNGKTTELANFMNRPKIKERYQIISIDAYESLLPKDLQVVDLFIWLILESLEHLNQMGKELPPSTESQLNDMVEFFRGEKVIEEEKTSQRNSSMEASGSAEGTLSVLLAKFKSAFSAKMKIEENFRTLTRTKFLPRLKDLVKALDEILGFMSDEDGPTPLLVIDGLDRINIESAQKLYVADGHLIGMIRNASMLLTLPIAIIHSPDSSMIRNNIGNITIFHNLALKDRDGNTEEEPARKNRAFLRKLVKKRMADGLMTDEALDKAITYSGGVLRTLTEIISGAAAYADDDEKEIIDLESLEEILREMRSLKSRPLTGEDWVILDDVARTKSYNHGDATKRQELLHGLFALEYMNDEEWYDISPLLDKGYERYKALAKQKNDD